MASTGMVLDNLNSIATMDDRTAKPAPDHIENLANEINEKPGSDNIEDHLDSKPEEADFNVEMPRNYFLTPRVLGTLLAGGLGMFGVSRLMTHARS